MLAGVSAHGEPVPGELVDPVVVLVDPVEVLLDPVVVDPVEVLLAEGLGGGVVGFGVGFGDEDGEVDVGAVLVATRGGALVLVAGTGAFAGVCVGLVVRVVVGVAV